MSVRRLIAVFLLLALTASTNRAVICEANCDAAPPSQPAAHIHAHHHMHTSVHDMETCPDCVNHGTSSMTSQGCEHPQTYAVKQSRFSLGTSQLFVALVSVPGNSELDRRDAVRFFDASASPGRPANSSIAPLRI